MKNLAAGLYDDRAPEPTDLLHCDIHNGSAHRRHIIDLRPYNLPGLKQVCASCWQAYKREVVLEANSLSSAQHAA